MSSNSKVTPNTRRRTLIGLAGLAASASALKMAWGAEPGPFAIKRASLLQRKPGIAAYQLPAGGYYLFDPNYGIFKMDKKGVKAALVYLARDLYTEDAPLKGNVDYELFGKA